MFVMNFSSSCQGLFIFGANASQDRRGILGDRENAAWIFAKADPDMFVSLPG
jgi:hypothetical protein